MAEGLPAPAWPVGRDLKKVSGTFSRKTFLTPFSQGGYVMSVTAVVQRSQERALEILRRTGNPFRNYFARNPDDEVCARYHVPDLYARERHQLLGVVDLYRYDPTTHSEVLPVLGNTSA